MTECELRSVVKINVLQPFFFILQLFMLLPVFSLCLDRFRAIAFWIKSNDLFQLKLSICSCIFTTRIRADFSRVPFDLTLFFKLIHTCQDTGGLFNLKKSGHSTVKRVNFIRPVSTF